MNRIEFLYGMTSPLPNAILKKHPNGNIMQFWGENPNLYLNGDGHLKEHLGGHTGIDIATFHRDKVYAAHAGFVGSQFYDDPKRAGGREVWVVSEFLDGEVPQNSQVQTVYCHLDEIVVTPGRWVEKGELLGYEGNTGFVVSGGTPYWGNAPAGKGVHLHFGLYEMILKNGKWTQRYDVTLPLKGSSDPLPYITETKENPLGDVSGLGVVLNNMVTYLKKIKLWK